MKFFLDTADLQSIQKWSATGIIAGVTTNPTHLANAGGEPVQIIKKICAYVPDGSVSVEVTEIDPELVYAQAKAIARLSHQIVVKIPCHVQYYSIIKKLVDEHIPLNVTLVFSLMQGVAMCNLGVDYISPFVGRLDDANVSGVKLVEDLVHMRNLYNYRTKILAASIRSLERLQNVASAGADFATVPSVVLEKALTHPLTDKGMHIFEQDWKKLDITKFP